MYVCMYVYIYIYIYRGPQGAEVRAERLLPVRHGMINWRKTKVVLVKVVS